MYFNVLYHDLELLMLPKRILSNFHFTIFLTLNNQKRAKLEFVTENTVIQFLLINNNFSFPIIDIGLEDDIILRRAAH